jgi:hypothetical protein
MKKGFSDVNVQIFVIFSPDLSARSNSDHSPGLNVKIYAEFSSDLQPCSVLDPSAAFDNFPCFLPFGGRSHVT